MSETNDRVEQFRADIASMKVRDPAAGRDRVLVRAGAVGMAIGVALTVGAFFWSHNTADPLNQRDATTLALVGAALAVAGTGIWLRYSLAGFLRFWLARLIFEQRAQTDRLVEADVHPRP